MSAKRMPPRPEAMDERKCSQTLSLRMTDDLVAMIDRLAAAHGAAGIMDGRLTPMSRSAALRWAATVGAQVLIEKLAVAPVEAFVEVANEAQA